MEITAQLNSPDRIYFPGEEIVCTWKICLANPTKVRSIVSRYCGEVKTSKKYNDDDSARTEVVLDESQTLFGVEDGPARTLQAGIHTYESRLRLPNVLPQTYKEATDPCVRASIEYTTTLEVDVAKFLNSLLINKYHEVFYIGPHFDLNEHRYLQAEVNDDEDKTFGCCCWESDSLKLVTKLPRKGFVPGERIKFNVEVNNDSDVNIESMEVKLVEKISMPNVSGYKIARCLFMQDFGKPNENLVLKQQRKVFPVEMYLDPTMRFKVFAGSSIIFAKYFVQVEVITAGSAITGGCQSDLSNATEIVIGTIPFDNLPIVIETRPLATSLPRPLAAPVPMPSPSAPNADYASAPPEGAITEQPLPNYFDAVYNPPVPSVMIPVPSGANGEATSNEPITPPPKFEEVQKLLQNSKLNT